MENNGLGFRAKLWKAYLDRQRKRMEEPKAHVRPMLSPQRRELCLKFVDGYTQNVIVAEHFCRLTRCDEVLSYFIRQGLTGKKFNDFLTFEQHGSILECAKYAIQKINHDLSKSPIIADVDYL